MILVNCKSYLGIILITYSNQNMDNIDSNIVNNVDSHNHLNINVIHVEYVSGKFLIWHAEGIKYLNFLF